MRVLIVSDTHGLIDARIAALAQGCDAVVHGGDVGAAGVLAALGASLPDGRVTAVRGNTTSRRNGPRANTVRLPRCRSRPDSICPAAGSSSCTATAGRREAATRRCVGRSRLRAPSFTGIVTGSRWMSMRSPGS
ncbi:MAG TPA: metallophosphoesterase family protein [Tahibacter sp.]|nr:metallophosphoesterase family protein [Tahibacter sp.]HSX59351.1 metallophosphoesterase family protein [Tahibacter sp.]